MSQFRAVSRIGPFLEKAQEQDGRLYVARKQPARNAILETVSEIRKDRLAKTLSFGRPELSIPFEDYERLTRANPDLRSTDAATKTAAWRRFLRSADSAPYRVQASGRSRPRSNGGL